MGASSFDHFRQFLTLGRQKSFRAAAEELFITQPALSRNIAALEKDLGHTLVERTQPLRLTEAGKIVFSHASSFLREYDDMMQDLDMFDCTYLGEVRVQSTDDPVARDFILKSAIPLSNRISVRFVDTGRKPARQAIADNDIDLSFSWVFACPGSSTVSQQEDDTLARLSANPAGDELAYVISSAVAPEYETCLSIEDMSELPIGRSDDASAATSCSPDAALAQFFEQAKLRPRWTFMVGATMAEKLVTRDKPFGIIVPLHHIEQYVPSAFLTEIAICPINASLLRRFTYIEHKTLNTNPALQALLNSMHR